MCVIRDLQITMPKIPSDDPNLSPKEAMYSTTAAMPAKPSKFRVPVSHLWNWEGFGGPGRVSAQTLSL